MYQQYHIPYSWKVFWLCFLKHDLLHQEIMHSLHAFICDQINLRVKRYGQSMIFVCSYIKIGLSNFLEIILLRPSVITQFSDLICFQVLIIACVFVLCDSFFFKFEIDIQNTGDTNITETTTKRQMNLFIKINNRQSTTT